MTTNVVRKILVGKIGTLMMANAELAAENLTLAARETEHRQHLDMLRAELARWQETAAAKEAANAGLVEEIARLSGTGITRNGVDRPVGDNLPANPYAEGEVKH